VIEDPDLAETREWIRALDSMLAFQGADRAFDLLDEGFGEVSGALRAAVDDGLITRNPCQATSVRGRWLRACTTSP
jgi:pyruvate dehydrogenase complex dehydrogenase (E1) component